MKLTLTNGNYIKSLVHETTHFTEGTQEWLEVTNYIFGKDGSSVTSIIERVKNSGYGITQEDVDTVLTAVKEGKLGDTEFTDKQLTLVSEVIAMKMEETFSDARSVERLVNDNPSLAKRIWERIKALVETLGKSKEEKEQIKKLRETEKLFRKALENAGVEYIESETEKSATNEAESDNQSTIKYSRMNSKSFTENVSDIISMSDEDAQKNAEEANFIRILQNTPEIILENVENSADLEVIIRFDALYLATRKSGVLKGHYHNLGNTIKKLPEFISSPDAILRMNNGRLNIFAEIPSEKGNNGIISIELNTVKDINSNYKKYNLVISAFSAKDSYTRNNIEKNGVKVEYQKEDLSQVNPQLYEWLAIVNDKSSTDSISQTEEKSTPSEQKNSSKIRESRKITEEQGNEENNRITPNMSDEERVKILKNQKIYPHKISIDPEMELDTEKLQRNMKSSVEKSLLKKLQNLGVLSKYKTNSIDIEFEFTGRSVRKSMNAQVSDYGGNLLDFAKVAINVKPLLDAAVLIEVHTDKAKGSDLENPQLLNTYVLLSAFQEANTITPVQFEVKEYVDNNNRLYLAVALTKIETSVMDNTVLSKDAPTYLLPVSDISIADLISKINPKDKNFFKYIPNKLLSEDQLKAKRLALEKEDIKYGRKSNIKHSYKEESPAIDYFVNGTSAKKIIRTVGQHAKFIANYRGEKQFNKKKKSRKFQKSFLKGYFAC